MRLHTPSFLLGMAAIVAAMMAVHFFARVRADTYLTVPFASYHMPQSSNPQKRYNENNIGVGIEVEMSENWSIGAGTYRNSIYRTSFYFGGAYMPVRISNVRLGLSGGLVTGYTNRPEPVIVPTATLMSSAGIGLNVLLVPPLPSAGVPGVIGFQMKWRF